MHVENLGHLLEFFCLCFLCFPLSGVRGTGPERPGATVRIGRDEGVFICHLLMKCFQLELWFLRVSPYRIPWSKHLVAAFALLEPFELLHCSHCSTWVEQEPIDG